MRPGVPGVCPRRVSPFGDRRIIACLAAPRRVSPPGRVLPRPLAPGHPPCAFVPVRPREPPGNRPPSSALVKVHPRGDPWPGGRSPDPRARRHPSVERRGFEPLRPGVQSRCSPPELPPRGGPVWIRTRDLGLIRTALFPPELRAHDPRRVGGDRCGLDPRVRPGGRHPQRTP